MHTEAPWWRILEIADSELLAGADWQKATRTLEFNRASRSGRPINAYQLGRGDRRVSITAGAHADEPIGPRTASLLPMLLSRHFPELLEQYTFYVVPDVNPDGAARNRAWSDTEAPHYNFRRYLRHRVRELPGDDIEFNYGDSDKARPENRTVMDFLEPNAPYNAHFSLHGMALAEGAWFLIGREWAARSTPLQAELLAGCDALAFPLHDMERHGEKGFHRIAPGFCTTPSATAMREHFLAQGDPETAALFLPSSMEYIVGLGGDPLCMVSELPLFTLRQSEAPLRHSNYHSCVAAIRASPHDASEVAVTDLMNAYDIRPVPIALQIRLQLIMLVATLDFLV